MSDKKELKKQTILKLTTLKQSMTWLSNNWTHEWLDDDYPYGECFTEMAHVTPKWVRTCTDKINQPYMSLDEFRLSRRRIFSSEKYEEMSGADATWVHNQARSILVYEYGYFWIIERHDGSFFTDVFGMIRESNNLALMEEFLYDEVKWEIGGKP